MRPEPPLELIGPAFEGHPAVQAWRALSAVPCSPVKMEVWREKKPTSIYRLVFGSGGMRPVFAKHCDATSGKVERTCHELILPRLPVASPQFHGSHQDADGTWWLFLEDVGREAYSAQDPEQRRLAGKWIGALHRHGAHVPLASKLPTAGPQRHWDHLRSGQEHIQANLGNPALTVRDREVLHDILALLERAGRCWNGIERALDEAPVTLVHGDFQPKNIRVVRNGHGPEVHAFDWELVGWGPPAIDLAPANGRDLEIQVDLDAYLTEVVPEWPHLDARAIERQVAVGHVLRRLAAVDWASHSLHFDRPAHLSDPVSSLRSIHENLDRALEALEGWR